MKLLKLLLTIALISASLIPAGTALAQTATPTATPTSAPVVDYYIYDANNISNADPVEITIATSGEQVNQTVRIGCSGNCPSPSGTLTVTVQYACTGSWTNANGTADVSHTLQVDIKFSDVTNDVNYPAIMICDGPGCQQGGDSMGGQIQKTISMPNYNGNVIVATMNYGIGHTGGDSSVSCSVKYSVSSEGIEQCDEDFDMVLTEIELDVLIPPTDDWDDGPNPTSRYHSVTQGYGYMIALSPEWNDGSGNTRKDIAISWDLLDPVLLTEANAAQTGSSCISYDDETGIIYVYFIAQGSRFTLFVADMPTYFANNTGTPSYDFYEYENTTAQCQSVELVNPDFDTADSWQPVAGRSETWFNNVFSGGMQGSVEATFGQGDFVVLGNPTTLDTAQELWIEDNNSHSTSQQLTWPGCRYMYWAIEVQNPQTTNPLLNDRAKKYALKVQNVHTGQEFILHDASLPPAFGLSGWHQDWEHEFATFDASAMLPGEYWVTLINYDFSLGPIEVSCIQISGSTADPGCQGVELPTPTPSATPVDAVDDIIANCGFENGATGWTLGTGLALVDSTEYTEYVSAGNPYSPTNTIENHFLQVYYNNQDVERNVAVQHFYWPINSRMFLQFTNDSLLNPDAALEDPADYFSPEKDVLYVRDFTLTSVPSGRYTLEITDNHVRVVKIGFFSRDVIIERARPDGVADVDNITVYPDQWQDCNQYPGGNFFGFPTATATMPAGTATAFVTRTQGPTQIPSRTPTPWITGTPGTGVQPPMACQAPCYRPSSILQVPEWLEYGRCQFQANITWCPYHSATMVAIPQNEMDRGPLAVVGQAMEAKATIDIELARYQVAATATLAQYDMPAGQMQYDSNGQYDATAGLQSDALSVQSTASPWMGAEITIMDYDAAIFSTTCNTAMVEVVGTRMSGSLCFLFDILRQLALLPFFQLFINASSLGLLAFYVGRRWINPAFV